MRLSSPGRSEKRCSCSQAAFCGQTLHCSLLHNLTEVIQRGHSQPAPSPLRYSMFIPQIRIASIFSSVVYLFFSSEALLSPAVFFFSLTTSTFRNNGAVCEVACSRATECCGWSKGSDGDQCASKEYWREAVIIPRLSSQSDLYNVIYPAMTQRPLRNSTRRN